MPVRGRWSRTWSPVYTRAKQTPRHKKRKGGFRPLFSWREICQEEACDPGQHVAAGVRVHQAVFQPLIDDQLTLLARIAQRIVHAPRVADIDIDVAVAVEQEDWR